MSEPLYAARGYEVTTSLLRTPRRAYDLKNIEFISVHQPLLVIAAPFSAGLCLFTLAFHRYLYGGEIALLIALSALLALLAARIGALKVHSFALRDGDGVLFGDIGHLKSIKLAVETAMRSRGQTDS